MGLARLGIAAILTLLASCTLLNPTDNALEFECAELGAHLFAYEPDALTEGEPGGSSPSWSAANFSTMLQTQDAEGPDPMLRAMVDASADRSILENSRTGEEQGNQARPIDTLLLSGGGQWGAYGAGFLAQMRRSGSMPAIGSVNGISTGAMQALFVTAGRDEDFQRMEELYALPAASYARPNAGLRTLTRGSLNNLQPLRQLVETELCRGGNLDEQCPLIDAIRRSPVHMFIGLVHANSGSFSYVDMGALLRSIYANHARPVANRRAQQCITAVTMGSSSIPVMLQRVRIRYTDRGGVARHSAFYDGGVRYSVFDAGIARRAQLATRINTQLAVRDAGQAQDGSPAPRNVYVYIVRNGPLQVVADDQIDQKGSLVSAALRGYSILVNQSEIMSIRAMQLYHPVNLLRFTSADGYNRPNGCLTQAAAARAGQHAFHQPFMQCLQRLGRDEAAAQGWRPIPPVTNAALIGGEEPPPASPAPDGG